MTSSLTIFVINMHGYNLKKQPFSYLYKFKMYVKCH